MCFSVINSSIYENRAVKGSRGDNLEVEPNDKQDFYPFIKNCKNVVECNCVTGDYSMLIEVIFETTMALDLFIGELQRFGKTKTLIAFSTSVEHRNIYWKEENQEPNT